MSVYPKKATYATVGIETGIIAAFSELFEGLNNANNSVNTPGIHCCHC